MTDHLRSIDTPHLSVAYEEYGPVSGAPVILLHGFPYDPRCFDQMTGPLALSGFRVIVPYLRGYGPTRFRLQTTLRSGQQAALGQDLLDLLDALDIPKAALMGYDWGGRAACIVAALWPERVQGLVTGDGYNIQDIANAGRSRTPEADYRYWYQYYLHTPRGHAGLSENRQAFARLLWRLWSPKRIFKETEFARSAVSFDNPDFVEVVVHSYRHRFGYAEGDPQFDGIEAALALRPTIGVPTISLCGGDDGVSGPVGEDIDRACFTGLYERRVLAGTGHNVPQEAPGATLAAIMAIAR